MKIATTEKTPLASSSTIEAGGLTGCPVVGGGSALDPAAVPLPVAIMLPVGLFIWGLWTWIRLLPQMTDGQEQVYHGVFMSLVAYPLGLGIPHARIKKAMSLAHGVSLLQGTTLIVCGLAWHNAFGFVDGSSYSMWTKYINIYGMWGNTIGILWGAIMGATDLLYTTKESVSYRAPQWVENVEHIVLKSQGLGNIIATAMILKQLAYTIEEG